MKYLLFVLMTLVSGVFVSAQNLDAMKDPERIKALLRISKAAVMEYAPDFYREYGTPEVIHGIVGMEDMNKHLTLPVMEESPGRSFYVVIRFFDQTKESFNWDYSSKVCIWGDTGIAFIVWGGGGIGLVDLDKPEKMANPDRVKRLDWKKQPPRKKYVPKRIEVEDMEKGKGQNGK